MVFIRTNVCKTLVNKKNFFCYVTNEIVILANLGALILKIQLVF